MINRFENCTSLVEIFQVIFGEEMVDFSSLTNEEKKTVLNVYKSCNGPNAHMMAELTLGNYNTIIRNVYKVAKSLKEMADNMAETEEIIKEEKEMETNKSNKFTAKINGFYTGVAGAVGSAAVRAGQDANDFKKSCDNAVTNIKNSLSGVLEELDYLLGYSDLKNQLYEIIYRNTEGTKSRRGFFDAALECRKAVNACIKDILDYDPDEDELKQVIALRFMLGEDEEGNPTGRRSIFAAFANGIVWICKKVARKLRSWFGTDAESNIFGSVGAGIASVFGVACGVLKEALKVAANFVVFIGSYVFSAVVNAIAWVVEKVSGWIEKAKKKFTTPEEEEDKELDEKLKEEENLNGAQ